VIIGLYDELFLSLTFSNTLIVFFWDTMPVHNKGCSVTRERFALKIHVKDHNQGSHLQKV